MIRPAMKLPAEVFGLGQINSPGIVSMNFANRPTGRDFENYKHAPRVGCAAPV
jgi:hypothetical protein